MQQKMLLTSHFSVLLRNIRGLYETARCHVQDDRSFNVQVCENPRAAKQEGSRGRGVGFLLSISVVFHYIT